MAALLFVLAFVLAGWLKPDWFLRAEFARQRLLARASVHEKTVGDHRWSYLESGEGPLVVLVHGFTGAKENWLPLMRELKGRRMIAPDLPGWGESERKAGADYGPLAQAERLHAFLASLGGKPVLAVGHSMGGQILGLLAVSHPDDLGPIVLMSSAGVAFKENQFGREVLAGRNPFQVTTRADVHRYLGIVFTDPPFVPWPVDAALAQRRAKDAAFEQKVLDRIGRGPEALRLQYELGAIKSPVLLLWCRDDRVIDVSAAKVFAQGLHRSQTVILERCGHMPLMAVPQDVARALAPAELALPP